MAPSLTAVITLFFLLLLSPHLTAVLSLPSPPHQPERATSPNFFSPSSAFVSTVRSTIDEIQKLISLVSTVSGALGGDLRLSSAVSDCLDLLDLSSDELSWTLSASQPTTAANSNRKPIEGTGDLRSDLRSWLSAALGNQDTCTDGLDGTSGLVSSLVAGGLKVVTSLVSDVLREISTAGGEGRLGRRRLLGFPTWITAAERPLMQVAASGIEVDVTVAADGSGNYTTVEEAVTAAPVESSRRYVIYVKKGVYKENVEIKKKKWNLMLIGDGMDVTVISGSRSFIDGWTTYRTATFAVAGKGFIARDITFENTAGPEKHQAVALRSDSDLSVFFRCGIRGYQDTLYAHSLRQFYRECRITGTVDFIFGNAAAIFQNCQIFARKPLPDQKNSVTAQGRKDPNQNTGFSIQFCNISADSDLVGFTNQTATYLGRPWKPYSRTVLMQSYLGGAIRPAGWLEWQDDFALDTLYYAEYLNFGPGSGLGSRVKWPGFHAISDSAQAANFTVAQFIDGNLWLPSTGVRYTAGLMV